MCLEPSLLGAPFRRDNSFSEADGDGKRRHPILNPSQDMRYRGSAEPPLLPRVPQKPPILPIPPHGGWLVEDDLNKGHMGGRSPGIFQESDASRYAKQRGHQNFLSQGATNMMLPSYASAGKNGEVLATASFRNRYDCLPADLFIRSHDSLQVNFRHEMHRLIHQTGEFESLLYCVTTYRNFNTPFCC